jgi:hypothetical protein
MSLVCGECRGALGKSEELPGREGTLVHPVLRTIASIKDLQRGKGKPQYVESDENIAICFECIEKHVPEGRKEVMRQIYSLFELEMLRTPLQKLKEATLLDSESSSTLDSINQKIAAIGKTLTNNCLFTGVPIGTGLPYFTANAIDRERSDKGSGFFGPTYQITGTILESPLKIPISFNAFREAFPETFENLRCALLKIENPNARQWPIDIHLAPGVKEALEMETGKPLDTIIEGFKGLGNVRIIQRDQKPKSRGRF